MAPDLCILILKGFRLSVFTVPGRDTKQYDEGQHGPQLFICPRQE